jgi:uncharacterized protein (DUF488 family)
MFDYRLRLYTIGHGTRTIDELAGATLVHGSARIVDVRRYPASRRHPHLARASLEAALPRRGVAYEWRGDDLGGRRKESGPGASRHRALRVAAFRAFADHMDTPAFRAALERLARDAEQAPLAIMCAETLWWRCHRRLIADALVLRGVEVAHIIPPRTLQEHPLHETVRADEEGRPVYDAGGGAQLPQ